MQVRITLTFDVADGMYSVDAVDKLTTDLINAVQLTDLYVDEVNAKMETRRYA